MHFFVETSYPLLYHFLAPTPTLPQNTLPSPLPYSPYIFFFTSFVSSYLHSLMHPLIHLFSHHFSNNRIRPTVMNKFPLYLKALYESDAEIVDEAAIKAWHTGKL